MDCKGTPDASSEVIGPKVSRPQSDGSVGQVNQVSGPRGAAGLAGHLRARRRADRSAGRTQAGMGPGAVRARHGRDQPHGVLGRRRSARSAAGQGRGTNERLPAPTAARWTSRQCWTTSNVPKSKKADAQQLAMGLLREMGVDAEPDVTGAIRTKFLPLPSFLRKPISRFFIEQSSPTRRPTSSRPACARRSATGCWLRSTAWARGR